MLQDKGWFYSLKRTKRILGIPLGGGVPLWYQKILVKTVMF